MDWRKFPDLTSSENNRNIWLNFSSTIPCRDGTACVSYYLEESSDGTGLQTHWIPHKSILVDQNEAKERNAQVHFRVGEVSRSLDIITALSNGESIENLMDPEKKFDYSQLKNRVDVSKPVIAGEKMIQLILCFWWLFFSFSFIPSSYCRPFFWGCHHGPDPRQWSPISNGSGVGRLALPTQRRISGKETHKAIDIH